jgi:hypothetical protein
LYYVLEVFDSQGLPIFAYNGSDTVVNVDGLFPYTTYSMTLTAHNHVGFTVIAFTPATTLQSGM